ASTGNQHAAREAHLLHESRGPDLRGRILQAVGVSDSKPSRNPARVAAKTNELTPSAAPICRMNCWLVVALPMRATGTLFCTTTVSAGESSPSPAPAVSAAT